jgi:hypothetical protein
LNSESISIRPFTKVSRSVVMRCLPVLTLGCTCIAVGGCHRAEPLGDVHGTLKFQGVPVSSGIVFFDGGSKGVHMTANVNEHGEYRVSMAKGFGLPSGTYRVAVYPFVADLPIGSKIRPVPRKFPDFPPRYRKPDTSRLTIRVVVGDNPYDIDMKP